MSCTKTIDHNYNCIEFTDSAVIIGGNLVIKKGNSVTYLYHDKYLLKIIVDTLP